MSSSVLVIGAGIAGLIAAHDLAQAGISVTVLEASQLPGGRAQTRHHDGFCLNQGPHALYLGGAFRQALDRIGVSYRGEPRDIRRSALYGGRLHTLPFGAAALATTGVFDLSDKLNFTQVMASLPKARPGPGSFSDWLDAQNLRPRVREVVSAAARLSSYANAESEVPAAAMLDQLRIGLAGTLYVNGGWQTLVDGLLARSAAAGAGLRTGAPVAALTPSVTGWLAMLDSGEEIGAEAIILACPPDMAARLTGTPERFAGLRDCRANTLDLALSSAPPGAHDFVLGIDQPLYASVHSATARLGPPGGMVVHFARYLAPGEAPAPDAIAELETLADLALPGWHDRVVRKQRLIAMPVVHALPTLTAPRPGIGLPDRPGVFLAGDWVGDEGMLSDAAAASAARAARAVISHLG